MTETNIGKRVWGSVALALVLVSLGHAQATRSAESTSDFGPNVRAYLQYLKDEEEVVDDRVSRSEIRRDYYLRNMNRIRALREVALRLARTSGNDYLPELEAVAPDELHTIFELPPSLENIKPGQVLNNTFRYLGKIRTGQIFYVFARLDPYEQAEIIELERRAKSTGGIAGAAASPPTQQKPDKSP